ncbi:MAG: hypothetical protein KGP28_06185 [Bdellovibrionales bacterium]|nr:hypothetical protein [Bdellovibrionales bacterium]
MKRLIPLFLFFLVFAGIPPLGRAGDPVGFDPEQPENAAASLLFLEMYNQGLAGGDSGVCIDFGFDSGKPKYRVAFDTEAFVTGKSDLNSGGKINQDGLNKIASAIAKASGGKTEVSIDGYADGQHFKSDPYSVDASIEKNQALAKARASKISELISGSPGVTIQQVNGHASPDLERRYPQKASGLNCPTRRKVVVSFNAPESRIGSRVTGGQMSAPTKLPSSLRSAITTKFLEEIKSTGTALDVTDSTFSGRARVKKDVEKVFEKMKKDGLISQACETSPFREITKAKIETVIKHSPMTEAWKDWVEPTGFRLNPGSGNPAMESACFVLSSNRVKKDKSNRVEKEESTLSDKIEGLPGYSVSGVSLTKDAGVNAKDGKVKIGYSAKSMGVNYIGAGPNKKKNLRGYYCSACGYGLFFHEDSSGSLRPEYIDRMIDSKNPEAQDRFIKALNDFSTKDPFAPGAMVKPRMFMISDCKDCTCDHGARIKSSDQSVKVFDPVKGDSPDQELSVSELENTCIIRPPVIHACNYKAAGGDGADSGAIKQELAYQMALQSLEVTGADINELINKVDQQTSCSKPKKLSPEEKIKDVRCDPARHTQLPGEDEVRDCEKYEDLSANSK